jgi:flagellar motility protein MotE (MotC chaperone)
MPASVKERDTDLSNPMNDAIPPTPAKNKKDKKKKKGGFPVTSVIVLLIILGSVAALLFFDLFGIREQHIMPYLRNAPLLGGLFEPAEENAENEALGRYAHVSQEELVSIITALEYQVQAMELEDIATREQITRLQETISYLRGFESQIEAYRQIKEQFDRMVALEDPNAYKQFFESISPENAERLYREAVNEAQFDDEFRRFAATFSAMDAAAAAEALTRMLTANASLVVDILWSISTDNRAAILNEMEANTVSRVARLMEPEKPELPMPTAPPMPIPTPAPNAILDAPADDEAQAEEEAEEGEPADEEPTDDEPDDQPTEE